MSNFHRKNIRFDKKSAVWSVHHLASAITEVNKNTVGMNFVSPLYRFQQVIYTPDSTTYRGRA
jgi:hypothetical protein